MIKEYYQALSKDSPNYQRQLEYLVLDEKAIASLYDEVGL